MELYKRYSEILEGLECVDNKLWTDERKIRAFSDKLDAYCDKCVKLVEDNNRRHLERLKLQRSQRQKEYEAEQAKYDKEIAELEKNWGCPKGNPSFLVIETKKWEMFGCLRKICYLCNLNLKIVAYNIEKKKDI